MREAGVWDAEQVIQDNPMGGEPIKWVYLAEGAHSTVNIVQGGSTDYEGPPISIPHIHQEHDEILYILKGEGEFRLGDRTLPFKAGHVVFIPAGMVHTPIVVGYLAALSIYAPYFDPQNPDRIFVEA